MTKRSKVLLTVFCVLMCLMMAFTMLVSLFGMKSQPYYSRYANDTEGVPPAAMNIGERKMNSEVGVPQGKIYGAVQNQGSKLPEIKKLIINVSMSIKSKSFDEDMKRINSASVEGFYVEESNLQTQSSGLKSAYVVFRVPADKLDSFMEQLNGIGAVASLNKSVEDVSMQYFDTKGRLETQQAMLKRLNELMAKADYVDDMLKIESKISEVQYNIDSLSGRLKGMDNLVDFATVKVSIQELKQPEIVEVEKGFLTKLKLSLKNGWQSFTELIANFALAVAWLLPRLVLIAAVVVIVALIVKKIKRRKHK